MSLVLNGTTGANKVQDNTIGFVDMIGTEWANSKTTNGYTKLPNGLIIQWGEGIAGSGVIFPIAFPTAVLHINVTHHYNAGAVNGAFVYVSSSTASGFTRADQTFACKYIAIGY